MNQSKGLSVASLVLGIISLVTSFFGGGLVVGIVGIILAVVAKKKGQTGAMATVGLVLSIVGIVISILVLAICGVAIFAASTK
jgi:hypothetical protein